MVDDMHTMRWVARCRHTAAACLEAQSAATKAWFSPERLEYRAFDFYEIQGGSSVERRDICPFLHTSWRVSGGVTANVCYITPSSRLLVVKTA